MAKATYGRIITPLDLRDFEGLPQDLQDTLFRNITAEINKRITQDLLFGGIFAPGQTVYEPNLSVELDYAKTTIEMPPAREIMQFKDELIHQITDNQKTVTRRLVALGDYMPPTGFHKEVRSAKGTLRFREDDVYAICNGRGKPAVGRIQLQSIRKERLQDITEAEAIAEGFESVVAFRRYWDNLYSQNGLNNCWIDNPEVYRLAFKVVTYPQVDDEGFWIPLNKK